MQNGVNVSRKEILIAFLIFVPILILVKTGSIQLFIHDLNEPTPLEIYDLKILKNIQIQTDFKSKSGIGFHVKNQNDISVKDLTLDCQYFSETGIELSKNFEQKLLYLFPQNNIRNINGIDAELSKPKQADKLICKVIMFELERIRLE